MYKYRLRNAECCNISDQQRADQVQRHNHRAQQQDQDNEYTCQHQHNCPCIVPARDHLEIVIRTGNTADCRFGIFQLGSFHRTVNRVLNIGNAGNGFRTIRILRKNNIQGHYLAVI
ncbi:hypothetical protein D3C71_1714880 [compost metagenome]